MQSLLRAASAAFLAGVALALVPGDAVLAQGAKPDQVKFRSADGVNLVGAFYAPAPAKGKKAKDAVVMLLHDFSHKDGGSSSQAGWGELASTLQQEGYAVLSFDFRGFGDSKDVIKETFWDDKKFPHNKKYFTRKTKLPETIEYKDFNKSYFAYLVNDVAAAKAYLDRANDRKEVNSGNVLVIGAGQGATIGALWVADECIRRRDKNPPGARDPFKIYTPNLAEPESRCIAGCLWLSISPKIEARTVGAIGPSSLAKWLDLAARQNKIPMGFFHGKEDPIGTPLAKRFVTEVKANTKEKLQVATVEVPGNLVGHKLLDGKTNESIVQYLGLMVKVRGNVEHSEKKAEASAYYYLRPGSKFPDLKQLSKPSGDEAPLVILGMHGLQP